MRSILKAIPNKGKIYCVSSASFAHQSALLFCFTFIQYFKFFDDHNIDSPHENARIFDMPFSKNIFGWKTSSKLQTDTRYAVFLLSTL